MFATGYVYINMCVFKSISSHPYKSATHMIFTYQFYYPSRGGENANARKSTATNFLKTHLRSGVSQVIVVGRNLKKKQKKKTK